MLGNSIGLLISQLVLLASVLGGQTPGSVDLGPVPGSVSGDAGARTEALSGPGMPSLDEFVASVTDQNGDRIVGVYAPGVLALRVLQQPANNAGFITGATDAVSQFGVAASHGAVGLLAHNYLSGEQFFDLKPGQSVVVVLANGTRERYRVDAVHSYQALSPSSAVSDFLELKTSGRRISAQQLFNEMYAQPGQLVFQTCIAHGGNSYWGRLFVVANPVEAYPGPDLLVKLPNLLAQVDSIGF